MPHYKLVDKKDLEGLLRNVIELNKDKTQLREVAGNASRYFIHIEKGSENEFGFSKFCVIEDITVESYIQNKDKLIDGTAARKRIEKITKKEEKDWISFKKLAENVQESFLNWVGYFFLDKEGKAKAKSVENVKKRAKFITISDNEDYFPEEFNDELQDFEPSDFPSIEEVEAEYVTLNVLDSPDISKGRRSNSVRKVDHIRQSKKFKQIGDRGEQIVIQSERVYLRKKGRHDLAEKVVHVSEKDDSTGYDILSFEVDGTKKYIEVKSTLKPIGFSQIFLTANELKVAQQEKSNYHFYIVYDVGKFNPKIWKIKPDDLLNNESVKIKPILYRVNFTTNPNS